MKKRLKRIFGTILVLGLVAWLGLRWLMGTWINQPPPMPADVAVLRQVPESRDGKVWLGRSSVQRREGLLVIHLKGTPLEMGYASGVLLREQMQTLESEFLTMVRGYVPNPRILNLLKWYVIYRNRRLSDHVPVPYRLEILGETLGCPDRHPELGDYYNRMLNYHAAHDVSYMMIDNPLVSRAGCTSFGAWGSATQGGHLLTGRNFDWEAAEVFDRDRVVQFYEPDGGIPFISLSWAGMVGVVSGMNRAGLSVTINGAPSSLPGETATPVAMVARDVLQAAHNLAEALEIIRSARVFVSTLWLLGSRADGRFLVVEKTPDTTEVREGEGDTILCSNHFLSQGLRGTARNTNHMEEATSVARAERLAEWLAPTNGPVDVARTVEILRDRRLVGGAFHGNGHRSALNAFIATHATVMDLTDGIFWAATAPHQLGRFVAFDVQDFNRELPERAVPPDGVLASGEYERAREARRCLEEGRNALAGAKAGEALNWAEKAEKLNPGYYENAVLRGSALRDLGRAQEAAVALRSALEAQPAFLEERRVLTREWQELQANP